MICGAGDSGAAFLRFAGRKEPAKICGRAGVIAGSGCDWIAATGRHRSELVLDGDADEYPALRNAEIRRRLLKGDAFAYEAEGAEGVEPGDTGVIHNDVALPLAYKAGPLPGGANGGRCCPHTNIPASETIFRTEAALNRV